MEMKFRNQKIIFRIGMVIAIFCFLMSILTVAEYFFLQQLNQKLAQLVNQTYAKVELAQDMRFLARHKAVLIRNILLQGERKAKEFELQRIRDEEEKYNTAMSRLIALVESPEEKEILARITAGQNDTLSHWNTVIEYGMSGKTQEGIKLLMVEVRNRQWGWLDNLNLMVDLQKKYARENYDYTLTLSTAIPGILLVINLISIGIGLLLTITISRSITGPLKDFTRKVESIADGDLSVRVEYDTRDEIGLLGKNINRMVTLRKQYEQKLEDYRLHLEELVEQRTGELNRQREKFISVLIHDLKGPITPILGFTRRLISGKAKNPEDTQLYLKTIDSSAQQLLTTIEQTSKDLREKSALDTFTPEDFDIMELARTIAASYIPKMEEKGITLRLNGLDPGKWLELIPVIFRGDQGQLKTMLENLLGNALKYTSTMIHLDLRQTEHELRLDVADDGPGIPKKFHKKIFEQYFQVPGSQKGTGIGLYSVMKVVENHGGTITVESEPGRGAHFSVMLTCAAAGDAEVQMSSDSAA